MPVCVCVRVCVCVFFIFFFFFLFINIFVVSEFELWSIYYIHFQKNNFGKGINFLIPPCYGLNSATTVVQQGWTRH